MNIYFYTLGCKVNQYESAALGEFFREHGHCVVDSPEKADVCVVNSCAVTDTGAQKSRRSLRHIKKLNPGCIMVLTGCYPQAFPDEAAKVTEADVITGTNDRAALLELIEKRLDDSARSVCVVPYAAEACFEELPVGDIEGRTRAMLKIEDGCRRFCAYCVVPYARGPVRSLAPDKVAAMSRELADQGYREIVLTGINLGCYGEDIGSDLAEAVRLAAEPSGILRVRLSSIEPDLLPDARIRLLAQEPKLCPHFHMALQSGCNETLRRMGRRYTAEQFADTAERIRALLPDASFTTDVITGFPGETEKDFMKSLEFVRGFGFLKCHVFPYSRRAGTRAADMPDQIPAPEKERRAKLLSAAAEAVREQILQNAIGGEYTVIAETPDASGRHTGFTAQYFPVLIERAGVARGDAVTGKAARLESGKLVIV